MVFHYYDGITKDNGCSTRLSRVSGVNIDFNKEILLKLGPLFAPVENTYPLNTSFFLNNTFVLNCSF